ARGGDHGRPGRQRRRLGRAALAVLPRAVGHAVRARELPRRKGLRAGCRGAAVAPRQARRVSAAPTETTAAPRDGHGAAGRRVADALREAILRGEHAPGDRIRQEVLAERCGASRVPVREALRMLEAEGLVTLVANTGAWVARISLAECEEMYQIRERVEPLLLRFNVPLLPDAEIARLSGLATAMESADVEEFLALDRDFHLSCYALAETSVLGDLVRQL